MGDVTKILDRLEGVRETGANKWISCCPAHEDRSPSLSIRDADGRILLHCFAGCETDDVLGAIGLTFTDIMPERVSTEHGHKPMRQRFDARQVLGCLDHESLVVAIIGADFIERRSLDESTWQRLSIAVGRINKGRAEAAPLRHKGAVAA